MVDMRVIFGYFWLIFGPKSHMETHSGACTLVSCFGQGMDLEGNYSQCFSIYFKIFSYWRSFLAIFGYFDDPFHWESLDWAPLYPPPDMLPTKFTSPHEKNFGQPNQTPAANTLVRQPIWQLVSLWQTFFQAKKWLIAIDLVKRGTKASGFSVWLSNETYLAPAVYRNGIFWVTFST